MTRKHWTITSDKFLSSVQIKRLLEYLTEQRDLAIARGCRNLQPIRDYYLIRAMLETGVRVQECCDLVDSDFNGHKLIVKCGKGGKSRTILLTRATANLIKEWVALKSKLSLPSGEAVPLFPSRLGSHYCTRGVQKRVKIIFGTLQFPQRLSCHSLRHTNCSLLLESKKVSLPTVRDNLGHHSLTVTNLYAHACGSIDDVDLFKGPSSDNCQKAEPGMNLKSVSIGNVTGQFLRKATFK